MGMRDPRVEIRSDHLLLHLEGPAATLAPHRDVVVPFSDIVQARAEPPRWPTAAGQWQIAAYVPRVVAVGDFHQWDGKRRLLAFDRKTRETLTLKLAGHPSFDEISVQVEGARALAEKLEQRAHAPWHVAPRE